MRKRNVFDPDNRHFKLQYTRKRKREYLTQRLRSPFIFTFAYYGLTLLYASLRARKRRTLTLLSLSNEARNSRKKRH